MGMLEGRIALITGASRGIGYFAAKKLAEEGAHVIALARTIGGLEELDDEIKDAGGSTTLVPLDITDFEALDRLGASIFERWGRLDCLIGNAGVLGQISPLGHIDVKEFEKVMAVNVTANWRLIRSLDPLLQQSEAGRALFISSGSAAGTSPYVGPYAASKAALEALIRTYAAENMKTSVCANLIDPATLRTGMRAQYAPGEDPMTVKHPSEIADTIAKLVSEQTTENGKIFDFGKGIWR